MLKTKSSQKAVTSLVIASIISFVGIGTLAYAHTAQADTTSAASAGVSSTSSSFAGQHGNYSGNDQTAPD
jgi:hypothetical protein